MGRSAGLNNVPRGPSHTDRFAGSGGRETFVCQCGPKLLRFMDGKRAAEFAYPVQIGGHVAQQGGILHEGQGGLVEIRVAGHAGGFV